jgi:hypothetical protein
VVVVVEEVVATATVDVTAGSFFATSMTIKGAATGRVAPLFFETGSKSSSRDKNLSLSNIPNFESLW